ncbi:Rod shape-determining protein MreD [Vibrio stylophorae]|uniref:Rod shape-determining protein MreD n=1 Tax=Vibrio stylophorae TaxID=659351 RepID=A0ABN8DX97_9VIBR|nr:rod shape-determining protein MreD [Vibrio stylophorae]CAH0534463.1 Rod shape-determining protein MreD [Vibrio stylophorae]
MLHRLLQGRGIIWCSLILAMVLQAAPWPAAIEPFRPSWILLVLFYWVLALPHRVNVGSALFIGLLWDLLLGSTLGVRGMMVSVLTYILALNFQVIRNMSLWQQAAIIAFMTMIGKLMEFWLQYVVRDIQFAPDMLWGSLFDFLLWPWIFLLLRRVRRHFRIK